MNINSIGIIFSSKILPIAYAIIGFGLLITVHEIGHFVFCKIFKIDTPTFSLGLGPQIFSKQIGKTNFCISAIPIGGYVEIAGLAEMGQGEQAYAKDTGENSFNSKPYWQKAIVILGGITFNLLFAYLIFSLLFFVGIPKQKAELIINNNTPKEVCIKYNLQPGDKILSINKNALDSDPKKLFAVIQENIVKPMMETKDKTFKTILQVIRNNQTMDLEMETDQKATETLLTVFEIKTTPIEGKFDKYPFFTAIFKGIQTTNQWIFQIIEGIKYFISNKTLSGAGGPIMIISQTFKTAQKGFIPLFIFLSIISINLAIINLLPIGALDGGQLLFTTIEAIIRRQIPDMIRIAITLGSWVLILALTLYLSYKDLVNLLFGNR